MLGLDAAGKTTILYKLHIGEVLSTVPTIGERILRLVHGTSLSAEALLFMGTALLSINELPPILI